MGGRMSEYVCLKLACARIRFVRTLPCDSVRELATRFPGGPD